MSHLGPDKILPNAFPGSCAKRLICLEPTFEIARSGIGIPQGPQPALGHEGRGLMKVIGSLIQSVSLNRERCLDPCRARAAPKKHHLQPPQKIQLTSILPTDSQAYLTSKRQGHAAANCCHACSQTISRGSKVASAFDTGFEKAYPQSPCC